MNTAAIREADKRCRSAVRKDPVLLELARTGGGHARALDREPCGLRSPGPSPPTVRARARVEGTTLTTSGSDPRVRARARVARTRVTSAGKSLYPDYGNSPPEQL